MEFVATKLRVIHIDADKIVNEKEIGSELLEEDLISLVFQQLKRPEVVQKGYILSGFPRNRRQSLSLVRAGFIPKHIGILILTQLKLNYQMRILIPLLPNLQSWTP